MRKILTYHVNRLVFCSIHLIKLMKKATLTFFESMVQAIKSKDPILWIITKYISLFAYQYLSELKMAFGSSENDLYISLPVCKPL